MGLPSGSLASIWAELLCGCSRLSRRGNLGGAASSLCHGGGKRGSTIPNGPACLECNSGVTLALCSVCGCDDFPCASLAVGKVYTCSPMGRPCSPPPVAGSNISVECRAWRGLSQLPSPTQHPGGWRGLLPPSPAQVQLAWHLLLLGNLPPASPCLWVPRGQLLWPGWGGARVCFGPPWPLLAVSCPGLLPLARPPAPALGVHRMWA